VVTRIRVMVIVPRMLRDIIAETLASEPDIEMVGEIGDRESLLPRVGEIKPDVVILQLDHPDRVDECRTLLYTMPQLNALAMSREGRDAFLYALRPHQTPLGNLSRDGLVTAIRAAVEEQAS
jgi:chemotaxis response regulator CheB